jgi:hypothetical protein
LPKFCAKITIFINTGKEKMAHLKHYHRTAVRSILNHVKRTDNYSNPDIDMNRSKYNFSLTTHDPHEVYQKRLSEVHCLNRANVNTLSSWCVTLPKGVKKEDQRKFFEESVKFLNKRYGERNLVVAEVHFDETTPHLHYCFIPIIYDEKHQREKVDRKSIFTLKELKTFHSDLQNHINQALGYEVPIVTGELKTRKNLSINELKEKTAKKLEDIEKSYDLKKEFLTNLQETTGAIGQDFGLFVTLSKKKATKLINTSVSVDVMKSYLSKIDKMNNDYLNSIEGKKFLEVSNDLKNFKEKNKILELENIELKKQINSYSSIILENKKLKKENEILKDLLSLAKNVIYYSSKVLETVRTYDFNSNALSSSLSKIKEFCFKNNLSIFNSNSRSR